MTIIDMHMHIQGRSSCSILPFDEIFNKISPKIDAICITDHEIPDPIQGSEVYEDPIVFFGVEILTNRGDLLAFGIDELPPRPFKPKNIINFIHDRGGIAICAHPFSSRHYAFGKRVYDYEFDAIELNGAIHKKENELAKEAAKIMNLPTTGGSDAHSIKQLNTIATLFKTKIESIKDIIKAVKNEECKAVKL